MFVKDMLDLSHLTPECFRINDYFSIMSDLCSSSKIKHYNLTSDPYMLEANMCILKQSCVLIAQSLLKEVNTDSAGIMKLEPLPHLVKIYF